MDKIMSSDTEADKKTPAGVETQKAGVETQKMSEDDAGRARGKGKIHGDPVVEI